MNITVREVARAAKVLVAGVPCTLNGRQYVAEAARARIVKVTSGFHYSPHHAVLTP